MKWSVSLMIWIMRENGLLRAPSSIFNSPRPAEGWCKTGDLEKRHKFTGQFSDPDEGVLLRIALPLLRENYTPLNGGEGWWRSRLSLQLSGWWKRTRMQSDAGDASIMLTCGFGHVTELSASSPVKWWFSPNGLWFLLSLRWSNFRIGVRKIKPRQSILSGHTSHVSTPTVYLPLFCELYLCYLI